MIHRYWFNTVAMMSRKTLLIIVASVVAAAVLVVVQKKMANAAFVAPEVPPIVVTQQPVTMASVRITRPAQVTVKAETEQLLTARLTAQVMQLPLREGDVVHAGDLLALLDDRSSRAEVSAAAAEFARYQAEQASVRDQVQAAQLDVQAQADTLARYQKLVSIQAASKDQLQQQSVRLAQATQRLSAAKSQLASYDALLSAKRKQAEAAAGALNYVRLTALQAGLVAERLVQTGDIVSAGTPLIRLIGLDGQRRLQVQLPADVPAPAGLIYQQQRLPLTAWPSANTQGLRTYEARVTDASLTPNQQMVLPLAVYDGEGIALPAQCFVPRTPTQAQVVLNQQGKAQSLTVELAAIGQEGAVTQDVRLLGQTLLCATSDVLIRLMAGHAFKGAN